MSNSQSIIDIGNTYFMHTYSQFPIVLQSGTGSTLFDVDGKSYIDMVAGIAVNSLGYKEEQLTARLHEVIDQGLLHCSNLYWNPYAVKAAQLLSRLGEMDRVFFCNSGTEANEAAIKLVRKLGSLQASDKTDIITMEHSFHGRTYASMTATGQTKYQKGFAPLVPGFSYARFNDIESVQALVSPKTCAIMVEPIQGEGGIKPADRAFLQALRELCDTKDMLLVFDEVQCGLGRTGKAFAWQAYDVKPDVITLAKALAGGIPMGALLAKGKAAEVLQPGDHAATFGGNLLASAAAVVLLERLSDGSLTKHVHESAAYLRKHLESLCSQFASIVDLRGIGLMMGLELSIPVRPIIEACMARGLLIAGSGTHVLRFVPPLVISNEEIDKAMVILREALEHCGA